MSLDPSKAEIKEDGYGLNWVGKKEAYHNAFTKNYKVLKPLKDDSKNWDETENILIKGDNLDALKILRQNYFESIKMIYIDPPYNTKSDQFIYNDNFTSSTKKTLEDLGYDIDYIDYIENIQGAKTHSGWLNFMYPRLLLAKDLIKEDGVIFISIDDNEVAQLKIILDEIFGENNFIGNITRATGTTTGQDANKIGGSYDSLLCYIKSEKFKLFGIPLKGKDLNRFNNDDNDGKGKYALLQLRKTGNADRKEDRENMFYCIKAPDETDVYPIGPTDYLNGRNKKVSNLWTDIDGNKKGSLELKNLFGKILFSNPKPTEFIKRLVHISNPNIVLDFVAEALPLSTKHQELIKDKLYLASNVAFILGDITSDELVEALKDKKECEYITVYSPNISNDKFTLEIESNISKLGIKSDKLRFRG